MGWYLTITSEMREAGLTGNGLLIYALVFGYSQQQDGCCYLTLPDIASRVGCTTETARYTLKSLVESDYIERFEFMDNGIHRVAFRTTQKIWGIQNFRADPPKNLDLPPKNFGVYNKIENKDISNRSNNTREDFDFRAALIDIGVSSEAADAWLEIRRKAKAVNSRIAFKEIATQMEKSGYTPDECIRKAVARNWRGFEAAWMLERPTTPQAPRPRYESPEEHNLRVLRQMQERDGMLHTFNTPDEQ